MTYMDKLYGDMQRVSRMMRTACPAVNARSFRRRWSRRDSAVRS